MTKDERNYEHDQTWKVNGLSSLTDGSFAIRARENTAKDRRCTTWTVVSSFAKALTIVATLRKDSALEHM